MLAAVIFAIVAGAVFGGRAFVRANTIPIGELRTGSLSIDGQGARAVDAEIIPEFGRMALHGGANSLMELDYVTSFVEDPHVTYEIDSGLGDLLVEPSHSQHVPNLRRLGDYQNTWDLRLHDATPVSVQISLGAGYGDLDFRGLALTSLELDMGAGEALLDLRGNWSRSFGATIDGGTGKLTVLLSDEVGTRLKVNRAIGAVNLSGLEKAGDYYTNAAYGSTDVTLDIEISVALGEVNLVVLDAAEEYVDEREAEATQ